MRDDKKYDAFISYKHDFFISKVAHTVLHKLEHYHPPKGADTQKKRLYLCIDDQNFASAGSLNRQICDALEKSEYLIYLACPKTLGSQYCLDEIRYFKKLHDGRLDNIIVLLLAGNPEDVFPQELCYEGDWEPDSAPDPNRKTEVHWLDLRAGTIWGTIKKLNEHLLKIAAPLLHCELDDLIQRDKQWKKLKRGRRGVAGCVALVIIFCIAYTFWRTWLTDYKQQAENALTSGDDNKALFYYAKALSLNPMDEKARINAQLLLQNKPWPLVVQEDEDSVILGDYVYPINTSISDEENLTPLCPTAKNSYILWRKDIGQYFFSDADRTFFEKLPLEGEFFNTNSQWISDAWLFINNEEPLFTFYWPEEKRIEHLKWNEHFSSAWNDVFICALQPGIIAVCDYESLSIYQLKDGICRELNRIGLSEIFEGEEPLSDEHSASLMENCVWGLWTSPDCSYMTATANYWHNSGAESICRSVAILFDTKTFRLITSIESKECLISNVTFQNDSQRMALIYNNNEAGFFENRGYAAVYDVGGDLIFQTDCNSNIVPSDVYFCKDLVLLSDLSNVYFLDAQTGEQICEPLILHINEAIFTKDGKIALECGGERVKYCRILQFSQNERGIIADNEAILNETQNIIDMRHKISDDLWIVSSEDRKKVLITDEKNKVLDSISIAEMGTGNFVINLTYGTNTQTAFVLDDAHCLYCFGIDLKLKKFASGETNKAHTRVLAFDAAKEGVVYLEGYSSGINYSKPEYLYYIVNDPLADSEVKYIGWLSHPNINDFFLDLISGESDYAILFTQKDHQIGFRFISIKTGDILADISHEATHDLLVNISKNNTLTIRSNNTWRNIWLGICPANHGATRQLMNLSGYMLSGNHFENNLRLKNANAVLSPDSFGSWSAYLEWTESAVSGKN